MILLAIVNMAISLELLGSALGTRVSRNHNRLLLMTLVVDEIFAGCAPKTVRFLLRNGRLALGIRRQPVAIVKVVDLNTVDHLCPWGLNRQDRLPAQISTKMMGRLQRSPFPACSIIFRIFDVSAREIPIPRLEPYLNSIC